MPLDDFLLRDENILSTVKAKEDDWGRGGNLYATNKRVIRYNKGFFGEKMDSLYYSHILGASFESQSFIWLVAVGIVPIILGVYFLTEPFFRFSLISVGLIGFGLILIGLTLIGAGIFYRPSWYQIKATALGDRELSRWRTANVDVEAKRFANFIENQISAREIPLSPQTIKEKEVITKEIVMVKCEYCRSLMPQTAIFCPNCGAKRR